MAERTIGHLYVKLSSPEAGQKIEAVLDDLAELYSFLGEKQYRFRETAIYADELEEAWKRTDIRRSTENMWTRSQAC